MAALVKTKDKKVALVTGGTRGIGRAISESLLENDYKVIASYISNEDAAQKFSEETGVQIIKFDASEYNNTQKVLSNLNHQVHGIDILVNNAGVVRDKFIHKMEIDDWNYVLNTNLGSVFNCTRALIKFMRDQNYGRIVNISSVNALKGQIGQTNYAASKSALIGFTKSLALESANKGITVNVVAPGYIDTDMMKTMDTEFIKDKIISQIPKKRLGNTKEIARMVLYLIGDNSDYVTGQTFNINGGQYM